MSSTERNFIEEVDCLSGCVFAHDVISLHLAKILIASGAIESFDLETKLFEAEMESDRLPEEIQEGYRGTLHKLQKNFSDRCREQAPATCQQELSLLPPEARDTLDEGSAPLKGLSEGMA